MQAQVFFLGRQQELCDEISSLLRQCVYENIRIDEMILADPGSGGGGGVSAGPDGWKYMDVLKTSMVRPGDFRILVECTGGSYWYLGSSYRSGMQDLKLDGDSVDSLLPAVAIMDRMVIMPEGIQGVIKDSTDFSWLLKPLDMQGVQLIDFKDPLSLRGGVQRVGAQVRAEVVKLCRRYMQFKSIREPDFDELSKVLGGVDKRFLAQLKGQILAPSVRLTPRIVSGAAAARRQSLVTLEVQNESDDVLGLVRVKVTGPSGALAEPVFEWLNFTADAEQSQRVQFMATPATPPFCPFWIDFETDDAAQTYTPVLNAVMLDVVE